MLSLAKSALESILTKQDILDFVARKKRFQKDYVDHLGKIMCGILLFNKHTGQGGEAIRDGESILTEKFVTNSTICILTLVQWSMMFIWRMITLLKHYD